MYKLREVVDTVIGWCYQENQYFSALELQKAVYLIYSEYLTCTGEELFDGDYETWAYGPVNLNLHYRYSNEGTGKITEYYSGQNDQKIPEEDITFYKIMYSVLDSIRFMDHVTLCEMTRLENSAWDRAFQRGERYLQLSEIRNDTTYRNWLALTH